jgi:hypothetical protein
MNSSQRPNSAALAMPGKRHRDDTAEGFRDQGRAARMRQPVGFASDQHESDRVEDAETGPHQEHRCHGLFG